ncbi:glycosyltransferase [Bdellovibrio bacteriovorus]|uniref:glycosyltransferase n=1 Tax=Bdellovibrio bacteriovorus TaxID=959 RepID=UPI0035A6DDCC
MSSKNNSYLQQYDSVVIFSTADWDNPFWTNKQHMACKLADAGFKVLYIESLGLRKLTVKKNDLGRIGRRLIRFFKGAKKVRNNIWVYSPIVLPLHGVKAVENLNQSILRMIVIFYRMRLGLKKTIGWTYNPLVVGLLKQLNFRAVVYHSVDDLSAAPRLPKEEIERAERELLEYATIVFVTSKTLKEKYARWTSRQVVYHPNVADYEHFSRARDIALDCPADLAAFKGPKIGFVGAISGYKVDFDMLAEAARKRPDLNWILIGKVGEGDPETDISRLSMPNIHLIGPRNYSELPAYLKYFDVVIIPSPLNDYTRAMFPMKFFEYLAAGKVVISTDLPSLSDFGDAFLKAHTADEMLLQIDKVLSGDVFFDVRMEEVAQEHTWNKRLEKMMLEIERSTAESRSEKSIGEGSVC